MAASTPLAEPTLAVGNNIGMMFVHSKLDDYGLDTYEFRVYGHITRRTGSRIDGKAFASIEKMAKDCGMSPRKLQYALKFLCAAGLLTKDEDSSYRTNVYKLTRPSNWASKENLQDIRKLLK